MGSLNNGQQITQSANLSRIHHQGTLLRKTNTLADTGETVVSSGVIRNTNINMAGVAFQPGGSSTVLGMSSAERNADNSVERQKFTADGTGSGNLKHDVTRKIDGIHTSVSRREAILSQNRLASQSGQLLGGDALGPMQTINERKIFWLDSDRGKSSGFEDWTIFDASGDAVGQNNGTTDTDITPNEGLLGLGGE